MRGLSPIVVWRSERVEMKYAHVDGEGVELTVSSSPRGSKTTGVAVVRISFDGIARDTAAPRHFGCRSGWLFRKLDIIFFSLLVEASRWSPRHCPGDMEHPSAVLNQAQSRLPALGEAPGGLGGDGEGAGAGVTMRAGARAGETPEEGVRDGDPTTG